jgi:hypothetical protein
MIGLKKRGLVFRDFRDFRDFHDFRVFRVFRVFAIKREKPVPFFSGQIGHRKRFCDFQAFYPFPQIWINIYIPKKDMKEHKDYPFVFAFKFHNAKWAGMIMIIGSLLCMMATIFCCVLGQPRILYQMAKDV